MKGVGARVRVKAGRRVQTEYVGESDGARFSQGRYRLYYGLNKAAKIDRVTVLWSDGKRTVLHHVRSDQRLVISR